MVKPDFACLRKTKPDKQNRVLQGWELTSLVHELFQQGRELSRESVQLNSGSRAQDRFNKFRSFRF